MKKIAFLLITILVLFSTSSCNLALLRVPTPTPTLLLLPSPTSNATPPVPATPTSTVSLPSPPAVIPAPTATATLPLPSPTTSLPSPTTGSGLVIIPGSPSGPYGVILVASGDVLYATSMPGVGNPVIGSFAPTTTNVMRTGPSATVNGDLWVQVQMPGGGSGWVNAGYLTEYVAPAAFCADTRVNTMLASFSNAVKTSNGTALMAVVSPAHGMAVRLWRYANAIVFDQAHAKFMFDTTYEHDWGAAPGSGLDSVGSFHVVVLPTWLDVFNTPGFTWTCNSVQTGGASYDTSWPAIYANVNFYSAYKAGPVGNEMSWRTLLIGVEYVNNQPYVFSVTQMGWEP